MSAGDTALPSLHTAVDFTVMVTAVSVELYTGSRASEFALLRAGVVPVPIQYSGRYIKC